MSQPREKHRDTTLALGTLRRSINRSRLHNLHVDRRGTSTNKRAGLCDMYMYDLTKAIPARDR